MSRSYALPSPRPRLALVALVLGGLVGQSAGVPSSLASSHPAGGSPKGKTPATFDRRGVTASAADFKRLASIAQNRGSVGAIVGLQLRFYPEGGLHAVGVKNQRQSIRNARREVAAALSGTEFTVVRTYRSLPYVALNLSPDSLAALQASNLAATIEVDGVASPSLAQSTKQIEATEAAAVGRTGAGQVVAIIDSGVDKTHAFLQKAAGGSKVVSEACYSTAGDCPNGQPTDTSSGSGVPCPLAWAPAVGLNVGGCAHGTHVAGIVAGRGTSFNGVAPGANLIALRVFHHATGNACENQTTCALASDSDMLAALQRVFDLHTSFNIASANMSIQSGLYSSACDADRPSFKSAIDNLNSVGVATVIASGNAGSSVGVSFPGCISSAVTVGSVTDSDTLSSFSNSSSMVDLLAPGGALAENGDPGTSIRSSVPLSFDTVDGTQDGFADEQGTSQAAPHVAGAFAVLKSVTPDASVFNLLSDLQASGKSITDPTNGVVVPRIRVLSASVLLKDTGFKSVSFSYPGGGVVSDGAGFARRVGGAVSGGITLTVPAGATVEHAFLYWMTIGGPDPACPGSPPTSTKGCAVFAGTGQAGALIGASAVPQSSSNGFYTNTAIRVYRAEVPANLITVGTNGYAVGSIGARSTGSDGEGVSLVVIFSRPVSSTGRVYLNDGAMTARAFFAPQVTHTFKNLIVPATPTSAELHVGMGDGDIGSNGSENAMKFAGVSVTPSNFFFGADGPAWDDDTIVLPTSLLPGGTTSRANGITTSNDSLAWAYAALAYQLP